MLLRAAAVALLLAAAATVVVAQPAPAGGLGPHASNLQFKPCSPTTAPQMWKVPEPGETGEIVDEETGRCVSILDCLLPGKQPALAAQKMGVGVLDECGAGPCAGKNQQWTTTAGTAPGVFELVSTLTAEVDQRRRLQAESWKLMGTFNPELVDNENVVVQKIVAVTNTAFQLATPGSTTWGGLKIGSAMQGGAGGYGRTCPAGDSCCLEAMPCVAPSCTLPSSLGWTFTIFITVSTTLYVFGGVAYNHKVKGEDLTKTNLPKLLPHVDHWKAFGGLVSDGFAFSKVQAAEKMAAYREPSASVAQVAGSAGGYDSLAEASNSPTKAAAPAAVDAASAASPFDAARSGSDSDSDDGTPSAEAPKGESA